MLEIPEEHLRIARSPQHHHHHGGFPGGHQGAPFPAQGGGHSGSTAGANAASNSTLFCHFLRLRLLLGIEYTLIAIYFFILLKLNSRKQRFRWTRWCQCWC